MRVVVLGYMIRIPSGGMAWHYLQYVLALNKMGYDVLFIEDSDDYPGCWSPGSLELHKNPGYGLKYIDYLFKLYGLKDKWAYFDAHTNSWFGLSKSYVHDFISKTDLVLNVSGVNPIRDWWLKIPARILIDTDPGFTQIKHLKFLRAFASAHTHFFSFGENIGKAECSIPDDGFDWRPTRQPLFLDAWKIAESKPDGNWTTIMQWDSYNEQEYNGNKLGMKSMSFIDYENLPSIKNDEVFQISLKGNLSDKERLSELGWFITDTDASSGTPWIYQDFIASSKGEWSIAKHGYVVTNSGWFSERSVNYLASGKPVILQDTGFSEYLPTGMGLFAFHNINEVVEFINAINSDYKFHCLKAREIAEEYFNSNNVLDNLINAI